MFVDTADIGPAGRTLEGTLELPPLSWDAAVGDLPLAPVVVRGRIVRLGFGFGVRGRLQTSIELPCSRCLEPVRLPLDLRFDLVYRSPEGAASGPEAEEIAGAEPEDEDPVVADLDDGRIDIVGLVREQIYLALPLKPLCDPDCPGLCPRCGAQLARGDCGCERQETDPRWAALKALKDTLEGS